MIPGLMQLETKMLLKSSLETEQLWVFVHLLIQMNNQCACCDETKTGIDRLILSVANTWNIL